MDKAKILSSLWAKTKITDDGHWLWMGTTNKGYGKMEVDNRAWPTHRLSAWIHHNLDLNNVNLLALHKQTCKYKNCWSHTCLYTGSDADNGRDYMESRTHCKSGHLLTIHGDLTKRSRKDPNQRMRCRECERIAKRKSYHKHKLLNQKGNEP